MKKSEEKEYEELLEKSRKYAENLGWKLNPDKRIAEAIIKGLIANKQKHKEYYCPCRVDHTEDTICPCPFAKNEIAKDGKCLCGLFVKGR